MSGKLDLVRTFMVCIDGSVLFIKVEKCFSRPSLWWFSEFFVGGILRMISCGFWWVSHMRILCLFGWWLCPQISLEPDSIWWRFELGELLTYRGDFFDSSWLWAIRVDSFEVEVAQEVTQLFLKFRCNLWSDSGDRAWGSWVLTRGLIFWKGRSNRLEGAV
jgi:hypothetical protein